MAKAKKKAAKAAWRARLADRLARSSHVFLVTLIVLLGIEILVDWNQTLVEINVLRDQIRLKGVNYAGLLARAAVEPVLVGDRQLLTRLATGILDDEDAIFIRITDPRGRLIFEQLDAEFAAQEARRGQPPFPQRYAHFLARDALGVTQDFAGFRERLANSRYRDVPQIWSDFLGRIAARFSPPPPLVASRAHILFQDRLRDPQRRRDDSTTWAITPFDNDGEPVGAILVAFDMARTNQAVRRKYQKGLAIVLFFVALIVFQNVAARRDKLRLLDLEGRYARAKQALQDALPAHRIEQGNLLISGALEQARGCVDGLVWDVAYAAGQSYLLVIDPDGDGIDAAAIGLHVLHTFRRRRAAGLSVELAGEIAALGAATREIPLTRPIGILLLHISEEGRMEGVRSGFAELRVVDLRAPGRAVPLQSLAQEELFANEAALSTERSVGDSAAELSQDGRRPPLGLVGPLFRIWGELPVGHTLLCVAAGTGPKPAAIDLDGVARYFLRSRGASGLQIDDAVTWARGHHANLAERDLILLTVLRKPAA